MSKLIQMAVLSIPSQHGCLLPSTIIATATGENIGLACLPAFAGAILLLNSVRPPEGVGWCGRLVGTLIGTLLICFTIRLLLRVG